MQRRHAQDGKHWRLLAVCLWCAWALGVAGAQSPGPKPEATPTPEKVFVWHPAAAIPVAVTPELRAAPAPSEKEEKTEVKPVEEKLTPSAELSPATIISETTAETPAFGPIARSYLAYLQDEQEVVDEPVQALPGPFWRVGVDRGLGSERL